MNSLTSPTATNSFSSTESNTNTRVSCQEPEHNTAAYTIAAAEEDEQRFVNPTSGRKLRNTSFYGRHSNDWLFGSVEVKKSIRNFFSRKHRKPAY